MAKAVVLLSGGLDSSLVLAWAIQQGIDCHALSFDYKQKHAVELQAAARIAAHYGVPHTLLSIDPNAFGQISALTGKTQAHIGRDTRTIETSGTPNTYVPARNTIFLAYATALAEVLEADEIHCGPNKLDCTPYVDCRPEFLNAFQNLLKLATARAVEGNAPQLKAPLLLLDKKEIILKAAELQVPLHLTHTCYNPDGTIHCGQCDACYLRKQGFAQAGLHDTVKYK